MSKSVFIVMMAVMLAGCKKRPLPENPITVPDEKAEHTGSVTFEFDHVAGNEALVLEDKWYLTENNDSVNFSVFNYYLSNFVFIGNNGEEYRQPESYYLVKEVQPGSKRFEIKDIPAGRYKQLRLLIGVDSARNVSGAQTGALDPMNNMFWDWNTGYIMVMIEGRSPRSATPAKTVAFHFGGFRKEDNATREVVLDLPGTLDIKDGGHSTVHIKTDILECFKTPNAIDIESLTTHMMSGGTPNYIMSDNYTDMFTVDHIE